MIDKIQEKYVKISNARYTIKEDSKELPLAFYYKKGHMLYVNFENKDEILDFLDAKIDDNGLWHIPKRSIEKRCGCGRQDEKVNDVRQVTEGDGNWVIPAKPIGEEYRGLDILREIGNWRIKRNRCETHYVEEKGKFSTHGRWYYGKCTGQSDRLCLEVATIVYQIYFYEDEEETIPEMQDGEHFFIDIVLFACIEV